MIEFRMNRNVFYAVLAILGLGGALALGYVASQALGPDPVAQPAAATAVAAVPGAVDPALGQQPSGAVPGVTLVAPGDPAAGGIPPTPAFGELTAEQDAAVVRLPLEEAVAKVGSPEVVFVDTRSAQEFAQGHIPGALSMPAYTNDADLGTLPKDKEIILYCA